MNFGLLAAEIVLLVWSTAANFNGFRVLAALLHGTLVMGVSETLQRWTEGATYIRQGGHHVGHWSTFLSLICYRMAASHFAVLRKCGLLLQCSMVCRSVCLSRSWALRKRLYPSRCRLGCGLSWAKGTTYYMRGPSPCEGAIFITFCRHWYVSP